MKFKNTLLIFAASLVFSTIGAVLKIYHSPVAEATLVISVVLLGCAIVSFAIALLGAKSVSKG